MGNAQNPLDVMAVFYEDHYNTMWEPPINKRVEEEDRSRVGYFFWHISFCHLIWKYDSDKELPYVVLCRLYITYATYIIIYIYIYHNIYIYIYYIYYGCSELKNDQHLRLRLCVCGYVLLVPVSQTSEGASLSSTRFRAECCRTSRQLRSVSPNIISYNAAIASCEEVSMVEPSNRCADVRCSEWDGFCWRMGFYNNERLMESFAIGASTWGLVEPPWRFGLRVATQKVVVSSKDYYQAWSVSGSDGSAWTHLNSTHEHVSPHTSP